MKSVGYIVQICCGGAVRERTEGNMGGGSTDLGNRFMVERMASNKTAKNGSCKSAI